ncbi:MAG: hypothetical protein IPJ82_05590 [Lewinellaceae bacterium]|nr:hypothetical protein [Lewinellaceae bacterium]
MIQLRWVLAVLFLAIWNMAFSKHSDPETMYRLSTTDHKKTVPQITGLDDPCTSAPFGQSGQQTLWSSLPNPLPQPFKFQGTLIIQNGNSVNWSGLTIKMDEGAEIRIQSGGSLTLQNAAIVEACDKMWRGITVESGATLTVNTLAQVNDAVNAITASANTNNTLRNGRFFRNYRSLLAASPNLSNITFSLIATGNIVDGLALKPPHAQQFSEWSTNGNVGFLFRRCSSVGGLMNVGASTAIQNTFRNCSYGIMSQLSYLSIQNCRFEEFSGTLFFGSIIGSGIYAENGQIKIRSCEFTHCSLAISLYKTFYEVSNNKFWALNKLAEVFSGLKMGAGVGVMYSSIKDNTLLETDPVTNASTGANWGFTLWYNGYFPQITDNDLYNLDRDGIDIFDDVYSAGKASSVIQNNLITLKTNLGYPVIGGPANGIRLVSTARAQICNNIVKFGTDDIFNIGLSAEGVPVCLYAIYRIACFLAESGEWAGRIFSRRNLICPVHQLRGCVHF